MIDERWREETERLSRSWMQHEPSTLATYLVSGVEDPRINVQSILTRHYLIGVLFGDRFAALKYEELRFATVMNWLLEVLDKKPLAEEIAALVHALENDADDAEGLEIPAHVRKAFQTLPRAADSATIPNYIQELLSDYMISGGYDHSATNVFAHRWATALAVEEAATISVLEPACGSANDFRFLKSFGIAKFLDYTGADLCARNIQNARAMFPETRFVVGNALQIDATDKHFDFCFMHDLLEHFSVPAMQQAVSEMCRVTRHGICAGFFQMDEIPDHVARPVRDYHINLLSMQKVREEFEVMRGTVEVIHIQTFLRMCLHCARTHNPDAYTFYVWFGDAP